MNKRIITLALTLFAISNAHAATTAASLTTEYNDYLAEADELATLHGQERLDELGTLGTDLDTLETDISDYITAQGGTAVSDGTITGLAAEHAEKAALESLWPDQLDLVARVADFTPIATMQKDCFDGLSELVNITYKKAADQTDAELETANDGHVTTAKTTIDDAVITAQAIEDAGVGNVGGLATATSSTEFDLEFDRLKLVDSLVDLLDGMGAANTALTTAQNAVPGADDFTVAHYDTALAAAQANIQIAAAALKTAADAAYAKTQEIIATDDLDSETSTNPIAPEAERLALTISGFVNRAQSAIDGKSKVDNEIALRTNQQSHLFDGLDSTAKKTLVTSIGSGLSTNSTLAESIAGELGELSVVDDVPAVPFPAGAYPGNEQSPGTMIATQLTEEIINARSFLMTPPSSSKDIQPVSAEDIENFMVEGRKRLRVLAAARLMWSFVDRRIANSILLRFNEVDAETKPTVLARLQLEWNDYLSLMTSYLADTTDENGDTIVEGTNYAALIGNLLSKSLVTDLLDGIMDVSKPSRTLGIRVDRARRSYASVKGILQHAENLKLNTIKEFAKTLNSDSSKTSTSSTGNAATRSTTNTTPATVNDDYSGADLIEGDTLTRTPLSNGSEILLAGPTASLHDPVLAEGLDKLTANIKIALKESAEISLGAGNIDVASGAYSPNTLGGTGTEEDSIQLLVDGSCYVKLNSNTYITGSQPVVATKRFGQNASHRVTFYSENEVSLRVKKNVIWDLSSFGNTEPGSDRGDDQDDTDPYTLFGKQIAFGGRIRLVLEAGAGIRFPLVREGQEGQGVVLYMNDESKLIFKKDFDVEIRRFEGATLTGSDCARSKFFGMGQIWLNKLATMDIQDNVMVGIEADYTTPLTDITLSLQRHAQCNIGAGDEAGGSFQIGNVFNGGSKLAPHSTDPDPNYPNFTRTDFTPRNTDITFRMRLNSADAKFTIGRNGFFGLGAGVINKSGAMNGTGASDQWQLNCLHNVTNISLDLTRGKFIHNQIATGDGSGSLFAVGRTKNYPRGKYICRLGKKEESFILGGGLMMFIDQSHRVVIDSDGALVTDDTLDHYTNPYDVNVGTTVTPLTVDGLGTSNTGAIALLAPSSLLRRRQEKVSYTSSGSSTTSYFYGRSVVLPANDSFVMGGPQEEFFSALSLPDVSTTNERVIVIGNNSGDNKAAYAYMNGSTIVRGDLSDIDLRRVSNGYKPENALNSTGYMTVTSLTTTTNKPTGYKQATDG